MKCQFSIAGDYAAKMFAVALVFDCRPTTGDGPLRRWRACPTACGTGERTALLRLVATCCECPACNFPARSLPSRTTVMSAQSDETGSLPEASEAGDRWRTGPQAASASFARRLRIASWAELPGLQFQASPSHWW